MALLACSRLARHTAYPSDVGGAEKRCRQSPHSSGLAHASARTGMGLCEGVPGERPAWGKASARSAGPKSASACGVQSLSASTRCNAVQHPVQHRRPDCNALQRIATLRTAGASTSSASGRSFRFCTKSTPSRSCSGSTSLCWSNATHQQMARARSHAHRSLANTRVRV